MPINPFVEVDYLEEARARVTEQFKDKPVFDKYLQLLISGRPELQQVFKDLMQKRSLDTAEGAQLDILGDIVGQSRTLVSNQTNPPQTIVLDDTTYRIFIKAKIAKNITRATPEDIIDSANTIFNTTGSTIQNEYNASYTLLIGKLLSPEELVLLNLVFKENGYDTRLIPKPAGVRVNYGNFDNEDFFAFQGVPNAKGYGTLDGTYGYGLDYGNNYGESDFVVVGGGKYAVLV